MRLALYRFEADTNNFRHRLVTGDETCVDHHDPEIIQQREKGKRPLVEARIIESAEKVMLTLFWDAKGLLLANFMPPKTTIAGHQFWFNYMMQS